MARPRWVVLVAVLLAALLVLGAVAGVVGVVRPAGDPADPNPPSPVPPVVDLTVASFNVLGSSHTRPRGNRSEMDPADVRMGGVLVLLEREEVDLVGFQELLGDQQRLFAATSTGWRLWPGELGPSRSGEASVAWRTDTWTLVEGGLRDVPDADGAPRPFPTVLLRHRETGLLLQLSNYHHPADTRRYPEQERFREAAERRQAELANEVEARGLPQLVTGDMNERGDYVCALTAATPLTTGAGGSYDGQDCRPPAEMVVDWVLGSPGLTWTGHEVVRDALVRRTTDHSVVVASARIDAADFPQAWAAR